MIVRNDRKFPEIDQSEKMYGKVQFYIGKGSQKKKTKSLTGIVIYISFNFMSANLNLTSESDRKVIFYENPEGEICLEVRIDEETVWLTRQQMAKLFGRDPSVINRHIRNVFHEGELDKGATSAKYAWVQVEGRRKVVRKVDHYNLDVIISVGYRVKSLQGTHFRIWATRSLRNLLVRGYTLHEQILIRRGFEEARAALEVLSSTIREQELGDKTSQYAVDLIKKYSKTWQALWEYDEDKPIASPHTKSVTEALDYSAIKKVIDIFRQDLATKSEASSLFGIERENALKAIIGNIEQTIFGKSLYRSREEKAANLLYLTVKDHPFIDGNKRIGALLFMLYLKQEKISHQLCPDALIATTLLVAESPATRKESMIRIIMKMLM